MAKAWKLTSNVSRIRSAAREGAGAGLEQAAGHVLAESGEIIPYETGELSRSGRSGLVSDTRAAVTYTAQSAVPAHELLGIRPANGRQRKYLETAMNNSRKQVAEIIAAEIRRKLH